MSRSQSHSESPLWQADNATPKGCTVLALYFSVSFSGTEPLVLRHHCPPGQAKPGTRARLLHTAVSASSAYDDLALDELTPIPHQAFFGCLLGGCTLSV